MAVEMEEQGGGIAGMSGMGVGRMGKEGQRHRLSGKGARGDRKSHAVSRKRQRRYLAVLGILFWSLCFGVKAYGGSIPEGADRDNEEESIGNLPSSAWGRMDTGLERGQGEDGLEESAEGAGLGSSKEETLDKYLEDLDFSGIDAVLQDQEGAAGLDFQSLVQKLIHGEEIDKGKLLMDILSMVFEEIALFRGTILKIVFLCVVFAILYNFANVFENPAVTEISFYMVYMLLLVLLMHSFFILRDVSVEVLRDMMMFLKVLIPTFAVSMSFSGQVSTAAAFYELTFLLIYGLEWLMQYLIVPAVQIYVVLELMNYLTEEEMFSRMTELLKSGVLWSMKVLFTVVVGINVVQNLLTPVIDTFKSGLIAKTAGLLPGLGTSINAVTEIMVGSGIIIKNGIGLAAVVVLLALCAGPLVKIGVMAFLYKLLAAVIQPVSDKRMIGCISSAGEGGRLLGKVVVTTTVMFLVTIAMVTAATTFNH